MVVNKIRCICCGGAARSIDRHDMAHVLECRNGSFVDGGEDYKRYGGKDMSLIEHWDNEKNQWSVSPNQLMRDIRAGVYDPPLYDPDHVYADFSAYYKAKEKAEVDLRNALFAKFNITYDEKDYQSKFNRLWYRIWNMPLNRGGTSGERDLVNLYFYFHHFIDLVL